MSKGILVECIEEAEVINSGEKFIPEVLYTAITENTDKIWVITRSHTPYTFTEKQFKRHFKIK